MKRIQKCPKCKSHHVRYKRLIGNPFGEGVWKCFKCGYGGEYKEFNKYK